MVTIGEGLVELTSLRNKMKRLIALQKDSFEVSIDVSHKNIKEHIAIITSENLDFVPFDVMERDISVLSEEIIALREHIDRTAHSVKVSLDGKEITLARLRMLIEERRADLARLQALIPSRRGGFFDREKRLKTEDIERDVRQKSDLELEALITEQEKLKRRLEAILNRINATTELVNTHLVT